MQLNQDCWYYNPFISLQAWTTWCNDGGGRDVCFLISRACPCPKCLVCLYWQVNNNFVWFCFTAVMDVLQRQWFLVLARNIWFIFSEMCSTWCALWIRPMVDNFRIYLSFRFIYPLDIYLFYIYLLVGWQFLNIFIFSIYLYFRYIFILYLSFRFATGLCTGICSVVCPGTLQKFFRFLNFSTQI